MILGTSLDVENFLSIEWKLYTSRTGIGSIPARGPIVDEFFCNLPRLEFPLVYDFHLIIRHINPSENSPH